jgi:glucosamine--fructose-6-phosphate aminotransferase (isomerizing)
MLKEIHEQADAVAETVADRTTRPDGVDLGEAELDESLLEDVDRILILAAGTSFHAGLIGRYAIEEWARIPVEMDIASEWRYRNPIVGDRELVIGITQSGETADTLAAMRLARERGARVLACTNVVGSQATRDADGVLYTRAGMEVSVAATKTFVCQVAAMYLLALRLAELRGTMERARLAELVGEVKQLPTRITELLDEKTPVVTVATDSPVLDKVLSNVAEVRARGAHVIAIATEGSKHVAENAEEVVYIPRTDWLVQPILAVVPLQLLAYRIARAKGLNVDQPRNLAKTVTVE